MKATDKRIDQYIGKSADFAKPILLHLRKIIHKAFPDITETIKWGFPHFDHLGIVCSMASFKEHCAFGFWKASLMKDSEGLFIQVGETAMGHFGKIKSLKDLPSEGTLVKYIKEAVALNIEGIKIPAKKSTNLKKENIIPDYFNLALNKNKKAKAVFDAFSYSNQKEYIEWLTEAKTEATREKRLDTAIEWIAQGKIRNWKYVRK